jgi:uncharacterized small protein (DUF1192 family)
MEKLISQMQSVLAVVSAILPITPAKHHAVLAGALDAVASALQLGELAAASVDELAERFAILRAETEAMARVGEAEMEAAFDRVRAASTAFRAAFAQASGV